MATKRPVLTEESTEPPRALVCAFVSVPGPTAVGVRTEQLLLGFSAHVDIDALTLKANNLTHIQRVGKARMLRVPVPDLGTTEGTAARGPFLERLSVFRRAVQRQLENESYDVVICLDLFAGGAVAPLLTEKRNTRLILEVADLPSQSFDRRWPVDPNDTETRTKWEAAERAALKAATLVIVPSRQAARLLTDWADPRILRVVTRMVDTRVFQPPTIELALDDVKTVAFLGGREGGDRSTAVTAAVRALVARMPECRVLVLGTPSRAERQLMDELNRGPTRERVVPVDISAHAELVQALSAAHVVVVPGGDDGDGWALPHRALEAMACGRPVVVTGTEAIFRDSIQGGVHARIVAAKSPDDVAAAVVELLGDDSLRNTLARNGLKQAQKHDLTARLNDLAGVLSDGAGVLFAAELPPLDDVTAPAPVARAIPPTALPLTTRPTTKPPRPPTMTAPSASPPLALSSLPSSSSSPSSPSSPSSRPRAPTKSRKGQQGPAPTQPLVSAADPSSGDVWAGDTLFEPHSLAPSPSSPAPERVKGAMLHTESGATVKAPSSDETAEASNPTPRTAGGPRSLQLAMAVDDNDDWSRDTIADASPVVADPTRLSSERPPLTHPPRSLLVEAGVGDMTAEDQALPAHSQSSESAESAESSESSESSE